MSHLAYSNLARLEGFEERGLNYTGIILDGWDSPSLLVHPLLLLFVWLTVGLPRAGKRGWQAWWCLLNVVIIHPMDQFVGGWGLGPKYLVDEFAILDTRYWVLGEYVIEWVCHLEFFVMAPLCYMWYRSYQRGHWSEHYWALMASLWQLVGTVFYWGCEWSEGFKHIELDWPPTFDTYNKLKYFWFIFIFLNSIWVVIPIYVSVSVYRELDRLITTRGSKGRKKKDN